ncbi:MAG TPA: MarR family transcriptional regulator, partial [Candidatus Limiplasma sp.]|nr:MarR family transcriptional regulator [Candidatus Limiplasma sp.]
LGRHPVPPAGRAGLFHTAFLMPDRKSLARWLIHAAESGLPLQGASDHLVSEAIYLADPEGNGIEVYADRSRMVWYGADGKIRMDTLALNLNELAETLNVDKSTVSRTLNHLVKAHLAARLPDDADRRYVVIRLTERGERLFKTTETAMDAYYRAVFERIPQAKRAQVVDSLLVLNEAIGSDPCC